MERNPATRHAGPTALFTHLLSRQVLRLSAQGWRGPAQTRRLRSDALCGVISQGEDVASSGPAQLRGLGDESVWCAAIQHFFQDLYRKSVGHELQGNLRRLGGAAHQGTVVENSYPQCFTAAEKNQGQRTNHQDTD